MDVEPFLVASVLEGILAQRLGRRVCRHCRTPQPIPETLLHRLTERERAMFPGLQQQVGRGCEVCNNSGYKGRMGFFEVVSVSGPMRQAITDGRTSSRELLATLQGHVTMRMDGVIKAAAGETTLDEVLRSTQDVEAS